MEDDMDSLENILRSCKGSFSSIFAFPIDSRDIFVFDFTETNNELSRLFSSPRLLGEYIKNKLSNSGQPVGIGRYNEDRTIYNHSSLFGSKRTIHLGMDLILPSRTKVFSPLGGTVHSFQDNKGIGDYGPTIILQHQLQGVIFYTLYGHLNRESLLNVFEGQRILQGEEIGEIGEFEVNGNWFEHLHFQIIADVGNRRGDFPGVCSHEDSQHYLNVCPDPNLILGIKKLDG